MNGALSINTTALANIQARATAKDYGKLASRLGKLYLTGNFLLGESEEAPKQGRLQRALKNTRS